jgi:tetratricopeptide (TPR) repeat protein
MLYLDYLKMGFSYHARGVYRSALYAYGQALELIPAENQTIKATLHGCCGDIYFKMSNYDEAINEYNDAIKIFPEGNPRIASAYHNLGLTYLKKRQTKEALDNLTQALRFYPLNAVKLRFATYILKGDILVGNNEISKAIAVYVRAYLLCPQQMDAFNSHLEVLLKEDDNKDKKNNWIQFLVHCVNGNVLLRQKQFANAYQAFRKACEFYLLVPNTNDSDTLYCQILKKWKESLEAVKLKLQLKIESKSQVFSFSPTSSLKLFDSSQSSVNESYTEVGGIRFRNSR